MRRWTRARAGSHNMNWVPCLPGWTWLDVKGKSLNLRLSAFGGGTAMDNVVHSEANPRQILCPDLAPHWTCQRLGAAMPAGLPQRDMGRA